MNENRKAVRVRRRMSCEIRHEQGRLSGIVIDLSRTGLFVQSGTPLPPRSLVEIALELGSGGERVLIRARVARRSTAPRHVAPIAKSGIGFWILDAPPAYYEAIDAGIGPAPDRTSSAPRFRVHLKQRTGPRSRLVEVQAETPDAARTLAIFNLPGSWEVIAVEPI